MDGVGEWDAYAEVVAGGVGRHMLGHTGLRGKDEFGPPLIPRQAKEATLFQCVITR